MKNQSSWTARSALTCFLVLAGSILGGSLTLGIVLASLKVDFLNLSFPIAFITIPVNEIIILGVTLAFAKHENASLKMLGLKKTKLRTVAAISASAGLLFMLGLGVSIVQEGIFGPDPTAGITEKYVVPQTPFQLAAMIALSLALVGPSEELAFRGFIQKGFENSFGRMKGLLTTSVLFGLLHGLNSLYAVIPVFVLSLMLGYVWQRTGENTTAAALLHGIYDSIVVAVAFFVVG